MYPPVIKHGKNRKATIYRCYSHLETSIYRLISPHFPSVFPLKPPSFGDPPPTATASPPRNGDSTSVKPTWLGAPGRTWKVPPKAQSVCIPWLENRESTRCNMVQHEGEFTSLKEMDFGLLTWEFHGASDVFLSGNIQIIADPHVVAPRWTSDPSALPLLRLG